MFTSNFHIFEAVHWTDGLDTDIYVVGLKDGKVQHLTTEAMYSLHHANAYQTSKVKLLQIVSHFRYRNWYIPFFKSFILLIPQLSN